MGGGNSAEGEVFQAAIHEVLGGEATVGDVVGGDVGEVERKEGGIGETADTDDGDVGSGEDTAGVFVVEIGDDSVAGPLALLGDTLVGFVFEVDAPVGLGGVLGDARDDLAVVVFVDTHEECDLAGDGHFVARESLGWQGECWNVGMAWLVPTESHPAGATHGRPAVRKYCNMDCVMLEYAVWLWAV